MSNPSNTDRPGDLAKSTRGAYRVLSQTSVGLEMGIAVILGLFFGKWLDGKAGTEPWLMILFVIFGFAAGFKGIFRALREADRIGDRP
jgi:ATP synthase protein I